MCKQLVKGCDTETEFLPDAAGVVSSPPERARDALSDPSLPLTQARSSRAFP